MIKKALNVYWQNRRYKLAIQFLRVEAERPNTDRQMRRYLNAMADMIEGK